ncbi:MAG: hypothetical protein AB1578_16910 [Thermodesulfobacteriota bacterium]
MSKIDIDKWRKDLRGDLKKGEEAFDVQHEEAIRRLTGLAFADLERITPKVSEKEAYDALVAVVTEARDTNLSQATLKSRIEELGGAAVRIAKRVESLARILV